VAAIACVQSIRVIQSPNGDAAKFRRYPVFAALFRPQIAAV